MRPTQFATAFAVMLALCCSPGFAAVGGAEEEYTGSRWKMQYYSIPDAEKALKNNEAASAPRAPEDQGPPLALPREGDEYWGWFKFWHNSWWAKTIHQSEAKWEMYQMPAKGWKDPLNQYRSVWLKQEHKVKKEWEGRRVCFFLADLKNCDALVLVNGKRAGVIYRSEGEIDVSSLLKYGEKNEFLIFLTSCGQGIPYSENHGGGTKFDPNRNVEWKPTKAPPKLVAYPPIYISDVFANTSWRQKKLILETEINARTQSAAMLEFQVIDQDGKTVKSLRTPVKLQPGVNTFKPEIPWADPITWEFGHGYMYTLNAAIVQNANRYEYAPFQFGFRELWRDGKQIYMNGHLQRFRTVYNFGANEFGYDFLHDVGYNVIHYSHVSEDDPQLNVENMYKLAQRGMGAVVPTAIIRFNEQNKIFKDAGEAAAYEMRLARNLRRYRNIPSIVQCYFGINNIVPAWSMSARFIGNGGSDGERSQLVDRTVQRAKKYNPNVLFFSHADGNCGDVASHNLYLNFTPIQEREEWLSHWSKFGKNPYQAVEFGNPYFQCWYKQGVNFLSEYLAIYYGEEAYNQEPESIYIRYKPGLYIRRVQHPVYWDFTRELVWKTNRSWRTFGLNGGLVWFNLEEGYGMPDWHYLNKLWNQYSVNYGQFKEKVEGRPDWAWPSYDVYQLGNKDFLGYIGGFPRHTDKTHAFYSGETIEKQAVFLWDDIKPFTVSSEWEAQLDGKKIAGGVFSHELKIADTLFDKIQFTAPNVSQKSKGIISIVYRDNKNNKLFSDEFPFEVYPKYQRNWAAAPTAALIDPTGASESILKGLGISNYKKVKSLEEIGDCKYVIIGKNALDMDAIQIQPEELKNGLRVLILPQPAKTWQSLGFDVTDSMSRRLYLRDTVSKAFGNITADELHDWRGAPDYGNENISDDMPWGAIMGHKTRRGPRWTWNMTVAGLTLRSPDCAGFQPLIEGEFDMNYSALLKFNAGEGAMTICTLDLEQRTGSDPAATLTADAVFADFFFTKDIPHNRKVFYSGDVARNLVEHTYCDFAPWNAGQKPDESVLVLGPDSPMNWAQISALANQGARVVVYCNTSAARAAGLQAVPVKKAYKVQYNTRNLLLKGVGKAHFRWRDCYDYDALSAAGANKTAFRFDADGAIAYGRCGKGLVVFAQLDPVQFRARAYFQDAFPLCAVKPVTLSEFAAKQKAGETLPAEKDVRNNSDKEYKNILPTIQRTYQLYARLLDNLGAAPAENCIKEITHSPQEKNPYYNPEIPNYDPYFFTYW